MAISHPLAQVMDVEATPYGEGKADAPLLVRDPRDARIRWVPTFTKNWPLTVETMACVALDPNLLRFSVRSESWEIPSHLVEGRVDRRRHGRSKPLRGPIEAKDFPTSNDIRL